MNQYALRSNMYSGEEQVNLFVSNALASGMALYIKTGIKPNRAWTPTAMMNKASAFTGKPYKRGQMPLALADLKAWINATYSA